LKVAALPDPIAEDDSATSSPVRSGHPGTPCSIADSVSADYCMLPVRWLAISRVPTGLQRLLRQATHPIPQRRLLRKTEQCVDRLRLAGWSGGQRLGSNGGFGLQSTREIPVMWMCTSVRLSIVGVGSGFARTLVRRLVALPRERCRSKRKVDSFGNRSTAVMDSPTLRRCVAHGLVRLSSERRTHDGWRLFGDDSGHVSSHGLNRGRLCHLFGGGENGNG